MSNIFCVLEIQFFSLTLRKDEVFRLDPVSKVLDPEMIILYHEYLVNKFEEKSFIFEGF